MKYTCATCGKQHEDCPAIAFDSPVYYSFSVDLCSLVLFCLPPDMHRDRRQRTKKKGPDASEATKLPVADVGVSIWLVKSSGAFMT